MAIATLSIDLEAKLANLERDFSKASRLAEDNARKMKSAYSDVGKTFESLGAALAGAVGVNFFTTLVVSAIDAQDKLKDLSKSTSLSVETLAGLSSVAQKTGSDIDGIADAINKLSVNMGKDAEKFAKLGIVAKDPVEAFKQLADVFNAIEDPQKRAAVAAEALGKSWKSAAPALSEGSKAIGEMIERGQKLSGITSESADKADELNDNFADLKGSVGGLATQFANSLVPSLTDTVKAMNAAIEKGNILESVIRGIAGIGKIPFDLMLGDIDTTVGAQIKELDQQLATLGRRRREGENGGLLNQWLYGSTEELDKKIEITRNQLDALKKYGDRLTKPVAASSGVESPKEKDIKGFFGGDEKGTTKSPKKAKEVQEASAEATAYGKSMQALADMTRDADAALLDLSKSQKTIYDLMVSSEWQSMPDTWKQTAIAQAEAAIAGEKAAESAKRLSTMLGETDSSKIEKARDDMLLLVEALEAGKISEEQYVEAASKRLETNTEKLKEQKTVAEELGLTFTSAFEDAVASGGDFSNILKGLEQDLIKLMLRLSVTEPAMKAISGVNWGSLASGLVSSFMGSGTPAPQAKGGVFTSPSLSAYSGGVYNSPTPFRFASGAGIFGEAGPEAIMPLKRGADGKLGVASQGAGNVVVNVINNGEGQAKTEKRSDGRGGSIIDVVIEQVRGAIASDISRGSGPVPAAMQSSYGLNRAAGAY